MTVRIATYALDLPHPYLIERGVAQDIVAPLRHGSTGALVVPTSGTLTITRPDGTEMVSAAAVTVTSSIATYAVTPAATETLGEGYELAWDLVLSTAHYTFRSRGMVVEYLLYPVVAETHLYEREPELAYRAPQASTTGWQPQIDATWYELQRWLIGEGRRPWLIVEPSALRDVHLTRALEVCCRAAATGSDTEGVWLAKAETYRHEHRNAKAACRLTYDDGDAATLRKGASPQIAMRPLGRPPW